jgi:hypothetical protein
MRRHLLTALVGLASAIAAVVVPPTVALAQAPETVGIRILDAPTNRADDPRARIYIVDHVAPGTTINRRVEVSNDTSKAQTIQLYAAAADVVAGTFQFGEGRAANDLTRWTTVAPASLSLAAGAKGIATVTVAVPAKATAGEQYGVVWAELNAPPPPGGGLGATNRVGVRMYLSVGPGGEPPSDFEVTAVQGQRAADGSPVVAATVRNTGARALDMSGELRLANGPGGLSAGPFNATVGATLGLGQTGPVVITLDKALPNGPWDAKVVMRSGTITREVSASITFPGQPASASDAVKTRSSGKASSGVLIAGGAGVLVLMVVLVVLIRKRRRSHAQAQAQEAHPEPAAPPR